MIYQYVEVAIPDEPETRATDAELSELLDFAEGWVREGHPVGRGFLLAVKSAQLEREVAREFERRLLLVREGVKRVDLIWSVQSGALREAIDRLKELVELEGRS